MIAVNEYVELKWVAIVTVILILISELALIFTELLSIQVADAHTINAAIAAFMWVGIGVFDSYISIFKKNILRIIFPSIFFIHIYNLILGKYFIIDMDGSTREVLLVVLILSMLIWTLFSLACFYAGKIIYRLALWFMTRK